MLKISQKASVTLSMLLNGLVAAVITVFCIKMPEWLDALLALLGKDEALYAPTLAVVYLSAVLAYGAIALLFVLLVCIRRGEVFTSRNVACLRAISWLCFAAALCYAGLSVPFLRVAPVIAVACAFMGMIIRVVKNAFEKAVEIKNENDLTV